MTATAADPGKLKNHYAPCFFKSRIQVATRLPNILFFPSLFHDFVHLSARSKTLTLN
jgi:hypothetical protein